MKYNNLGTSDVQISEVSFGCMSLSGDAAASSKLLHHALDQGITLFDTADLYEKGENEITVGKAFKGMRQKVVLATKVGNQWRADGSGWDWNPTRKYMLEAVEHSLRRLQTDYIDLYQLHGGTLSDPIDDIIAAFEQLQQAGKIRQYGISSIRPNVIRTYVQRANISSVMMQYSLLDRRAEESCLSLLQQHTISVLARGSLAQGLLLGKAPKPYLDFSTEEVAAAAAAIRQQAGQAWSATAVAAGFVLHHPAVTSAVLGIRTPAQLQEALKAAAAAPLTPDMLAALQQAVPARVYAQHR